MATSPRPAIKGLAQAAADRMAEAQKDDIAGVEIDHARSAIIGRRMVETRIASAEANPWRPGPRGPENGKTWEAPEGLHPAVAHPQGNAPDVWGRKLSLIHI